MFLVLPFLGMLVSIFLCLFVFRLLGLLCLEAVSIGIAIAAAALSTEAVLRH